MEIETLQRRRRRFIGQHHLFCGELVHVCIINAAHKWWEWNSARSGFERSHSYSVIGMSLTSNVMSKEIPFFFFFSTVALSMAIFAIL